MSDARRLQAASAGIVGAVVAAGIVALWFRFNVEPSAIGALFPHDLVYYHLPQLDEVGRRLGSLQLPLWNPDPCAGIPVLASPLAAVFYPTTWLSAVVPADRVIPIIVLVHLLLGGISCAWLFRGWGLAPSLAGAFGVIFVYACLLGQSFWPPEIATLSWLPLLLLCTERVMSAKRADGWWLALVAGIALQIFAGFLQIFVYGLQLLLPFALLCGIQRWRVERDLRPAIAAGLRILVALMLGAGIAAVQLAPTWEMLSSSRRSEPLTAREVHYLQEESRLGQLLENAVTPEPRLTSYELLQGTGYLGIGTLVLAGVALAARRRDPGVWCLAAAVGFWLILSDGYLGIGREIYRLYAMLPTVGMFRSPERLLFLSYFCLIALAALGASAVVRAAGEPRSQRLAVGATAFAAAVVVAVAGSAGAAVRAGVALAWVAGALLLPRAAVIQRVWRGVAALLLVADVVAATGTFGSLRDVPDELARRMHAENHELVSSEELAAVREAAGHARVEFVASGLMARPLMGIGEAGGIHRLACYEPLVPEQWSALSKRARSPDFAATSMANLDPERVPAIFDAASVTAVFRAKPFLWPWAPRLNPAWMYPGGGGGRPRVEIWHNRDALPRAYLVDAFEVVAHDAALDRLVRGDVDLRRSVLLDQDPRLESTGSIEAALPADIVVLEPERVEIETRSPAAALLVLTDTDAPGWHATVDGEPVPIYRANGLFRAVRVPAGQHRVAFRYSAAGLRLGGGITLASTLLALALWFRTGVAKAAIREPV